MEKKEKRLAIEDNFPSDNDNFELSFFPSLFLSLSPLKKYRESFCIRCTGYFFLFSRYRRENSIKNDYFGTIFCFTIIFLFYFLFEVKIQNLFAYEVNLNERIG